MFSSACNRCTEIHVFAFSSSKARLSPEEDEIILGNAQEAFSVLTLNKNTACSCYRYAKGYMFLITILCSRTNLLQTCTSDSIAKSRSASNLW